MPYGAILNQEKQKFADMTSNLKLTGNLGNVDAYKIAIRRAILDLTVRTLKPRYADSSDKLKMDLLNTGNPDSFLMHIKNYFNASVLSQEDFDDWHEKRCIQILEKIQRYYTNSNGSPVNYGKAQKIVNITFKGCYCLNGVNEAYFAHCHMALDSFTLTWYNRNNRENPIKTNWSNLNKSEYKDIVKGIREMDDPVFLNLTPLQKEFLIWPLEIMLSTVKSVNDCFGGFIDGVHVDSYCQQYDKTCDLMMANIILGRQNPTTLDDNFVQWLKDIPEKQKKSHSAAEILRRYGYDEN